MRLPVILMATAVAIAAHSARSDDVRAEDYRERARSGPQVSGSEVRRGGYSYDYSDTVNTYGDSRSNYGAASVYRDPSLDRQTNGGPFDHGYFFDSATGYAGGDSPYMN